MLRHLECEALRLAHVHSNRVAGIAHDIAVPASGEWAILAGLHGHARRRLDHRQRLTRLRQRDAVPLGDTLILEQDSFVRPSPALATRGEAGIDRHGRDAIAARPREPHPPEIGDAAVRAPVERGIEALLAALYRHHAVLRVGEGEVGLILAHRQPRGRGSHVRQGHHIVDHIQEAIGDPKALVLHVFLKRRP